MENKTAITIVVTPPTPVADQVTSPENDALVRSRQPEHSIQRLNRDPEDHSPYPEPEALERVVQAIVHGDTTMALDLMESGTPISGSLLTEQLRAPG
ncbi:hypothetical protein Ct61P_15179 [Colletotrichum tofieldiae]|nr:hypothetical protein Ct61P_15179 [Colletotrichum tofieldiae]